MVKGLVASAATIGQELEGMAKWEEWTGEGEAPRAIGEERKRPEKDREEVMKKPKKDTKPKKKRGKVVKGQPSIFNIFKKLNKEKKASVDRSVLCEKYSKEVIPIPVG